MTVAVHQFTPTAESGAVGAHTLALRDLLRGLGHESEIFAEHIRAPFAGVACPIGDYGTRVRSAPTDVMIYQMAIGSVVLDRLMGLPGELVVDYHNLTPARYLRSWDPAATYGVEWGRRQLAAAAGRAALGVADSEYNRADLVADGYAATAVAPVLVDLAAFDRPVDPSLAATLAEDRTRGPQWLFVGRLAAHKCQHHLVRALAAYRRAYGVDATLTLVGGPERGAYVDAVRSYAAALGLADAVRITGPVDDAALGAHYQQADVFVCLSEHEGFCVPLIEAMWHGVPVVTLRSTAIPETVGGAAIVLPPRRPDPNDLQPAPLSVAAAAHRVHVDAALRAAMTDAGRRRASQFSLDANAGRMRQALGPLLGTSVGIPTPERTP